MAVFPEKVLKEVQALLEELDLSVIRLHSARENVEFSQQCVQLIQRLHKTFDGAGVVEAADLFREMEAVLLVGLRLSEEPASKLFELALLGLQETRDFLKTTGADPKSPPDATKKILKILDLMQKITGGRTPEKGEKNPTAARLGDLLTQSGLVTPEKIRVALQQQKHLKEVRREKEAAEAASTILVTSKSLDHLVNLIGELITLQTRLNQLVTSYPDQEVISTTHGIEQLTNSMRDTAMNIRMMGISTIYNRLRRLLRDLSDETRRESELIADDDGLELDKTVLELLDEPMVELVKFCVFQDFEAPEKRQAAGKNRKNTLRLVTTRSGGQALVRLSSNGGVLRRETLEKMGNVSEGQADLSYDELLRLAFLPRLSDEALRSQQVARDYPLAVVRALIEEMRGSLEVAGQPGESFELRLILPLTLAIYQGLLVQIGGHFFLLPLFSVSECRERVRTDREEQLSNSIILVRGEMVPFVSLRKLLRIEGEVPPVEYIVITTIDRQRVGLVVDRVVGELQTVVKPLGRFLREAVWFQGATILGDGTIALILNINRVAASAEAAQGAIT